MDKKKGGMLARGVLGFPLEQCKYSWSNMQGFHPGAMRDATFSP